VTKFTTSFFGGKKSLIENHVNLCQGTHRAKLVFTGQNGRISSTNAPIGTSCGKK
jgi:hypothetical protein